jgi:hypothetical protein
MSQALGAILRRLGAQRIGADCNDNLVIGGTRLYYGSDGFSKYSGYFDFTVGGGGGMGADLAYSPGSGTIDPSITGFEAGLGGSGTGRLKVTLSGNTSFEGLPAGVDGQQLYIIVVSGNYTLTLLALNGSTAQAEMMASGALALNLYDCAQLFYDGTLSQWVMVP